ncbi:MAG: hypothetical protein ACFFDH_04525 [Promethearchaeota archaeon]
MPNNFYRFTLKSEEPRIIQGDIFKNLPLYTSNFLINPAEMNPSTSKIIKNIIREKKPKLVESFLIPSWGILASQDCDILPNFDLIFYPMIKTKKAEEWDNIADFIKNSINNTTRSCYLPKIETDDGNYQLGPFQVLFQKPFIIPYNILIREDILSKCWVARIIEPANRVFIGKLTNFFSRTPIDEVIFLENNEISKLINHFWKNEIWKETKMRINERLFNKAFEKVNEIINLLIMVNRKDDINEICFFNKELVNFIYDKLDLLLLENHDDRIIDILQACRDIIDDNMEGICEKMKNVLNGVYIGENSICIQYNSPDYQKRFKENIKILKKGDKIPSVSEYPFKNDNEIKGLGYKIEKALKDLLLYKKIAPKYLELTLFLEKYYS